MKIAAHTLVKNEARFVWFAILSVIEHVDKILLWDTGSSDCTARILEEIKKRYPKKVNLSLLEEIDIYKFAEVRQQMLEETREDWFVVIDGDEIWWEESIIKVKEFIKKYGQDYESIVVPTINLVGDIYRFQEEAAGQYRLAGRKGHLSLRAINRRIPGLTSSNPHGTWGWVDGNGKMIQNRDPRKIRYLEAPYMHASFLRRAGTRSDDLKVPRREKKLKHEIGIKVSPDFYYPEVFFRPRPDFVESPWEKMPTSFYLRSLVETPFRKFKRRYLPHKVGY